MLHQNSSIALQMHPYPVEQAERLNVLAYRSVAVPPPAESDLQALVRTSQARNRALGLTGVLLYDNGTFFQWLEGPEEGLSRVWSSIQRDPRHCDVTLLRDEPISDRVFEGWALKFAKGSRVHVEAAIAALDSSERLVSVLGRPESVLNRSLRDVFASQVLPQLAELHVHSSRAGILRSPTARIWHAAPGTGEALARLLMQPDSGNSASYLDSLLDQGASFNALYQEVFEPAQLQLGKLWDSHVCDDFHLSVGLARLQIELRRVNATMQSVNAGSPGHSVLLSSQPLESHQMGLAMSSEVFDRSGWDVTCEYPGDDRALSDLVHGRWFDVLKLSQSGSVRRDGRLSSMRTTIDSVRAQSLNPALIVMVDGRTFIERPHMFRAVHANAMSYNALESVVVATRLLQASRSINVTYCATPA
jgi:methanogenic corrinoid protein MtbC1